MADPAFELLISQHDASNTWRSRWSARWKRTSELLRRMPSSSRDFIV
jgi:hypothetical protein